MRITDFLQEVHNTIPYYPKLARFLGSTNAAIFLSQIAYWTGKQRDEEGWIYKSQEEIEDETGLSKREQMSARKVLRGLAILEEKYARLEHKLFYRLNSERLCELWDANFAMCSKSISRSAPSALREVLQEHFVNKEALDYSQKITTKEENPPTPLNRGGVSRNNEICQHIGSFGVNPNDFLPIWEKWIECKQGRKWKNIKAEKAGISRLMNLCRKNSTTAQRLVDHAISLNWQGLFWPKEWDQNKPDSSPHIPAQPQRHRPFTCKTCKVRYMVDVEPHLPVSWQAGFCSTCYDSLGKENGTAEIRSGKPVSLLNIFEGAPEIQ